MKQNIRKSGLHGYPNECSLSLPPCCCLATHSDKWFYVLRVATVWGVACSCQITSQHRWERFAEDCMAGWFQGRCEWVPFSPTTASLLTQSCSGVCVRARVAFQPHGSRSIAQWILAHWRHCVCITECMCVRGPEGARVWSRPEESLCWFDWFSQSHLKLWMTWSPVAISRLQPQSPLLPNTTQHNVIHLPLSPSLTLFHACLQQLLAHKYAHFFSPPLFTLFRLYTSSSCCFLPCLAFTLIHSLKWYKQPDTHKHVILVRRGVSLWNLMMWFDSIHLHSSSWVSDWIPRFGFKTVYLPKA